MANSDSLIRIFRDVERLLANLPDYFKTQRNGSDYFLGKFFQKSPS